MVDSYDFDRAFTTADQELDETASVFVKVGDVFYDVSDVRVGKSENVIVIEVEE
jgi:hypothetical protein